MFFDARRAPDWGSRGLRTSVSLDGAARRWTAPLCVRPSCFSLVRGVSVRMRSIRAALRGRVRDELVMRMGGARRPWRAPGRVMQRAPA